jgi:two-component system cell cycle response regulator
MLNALSTTAQLPVQGVALKLLVKGFNAMELRLLEGTVKLSQRRPPRIDLVEDTDAAGADVVMIDANDARAVQWSRTQPWLAGKAVIWAGAHAACPEHIVVDRHVKWPILPVLLYRALEHGGQRTAPAASQRSGASAPPRRVLVVDDSLAVRGYLRSLLEQQRARRCQRRGRHRGGRDRTIWLHPDGRDDARH